MEIPSRGLSAAAAGPSEAEKTAWRLEISGVVQGVGYRDWLVKTALRTGLTGWVRNLRDGRVEAHVEGLGGPVRQLIEACWRGPSHARVTDVRASRVAPEHAEDFRRLPTA
jgi:acylphosphatase